MKKSIFLCLLAVLMLLSVCAFCEAAGEAPADDTIVEEEIIEEPLASSPLPIDFTGGMPLKEEMFKGDNLYEDPTIRVEITYKDISSYIKGYKSRNAGAWIVDIQVGDASQLRTAAAESFNTDNSLPVEAMADRVNAVVAFNGDYVTRLNEGFIIRQGTSYRDKLKGRRDVLEIDEDGDFHVFHLPKKGELSDTVDGKKVLNAFYFGPILVENGEVPKKLPDFTYLKPEKYYARLAICQVGPLHYKMILTTMEQDYTLGLPLKDFAALCRDEGAVTAYNLDGGLSTSLIFHGNRINGQNKVNFREVPDIVYFASSWNGEGKQ